MSYHVQIMPRAERQMHTLPRMIKRRIDGAILRLAANPRPVGCRKLAGYEGAWRIRVGDYRIIYEIHDDVLLVMVIEVGHRGSVYR